MGNCQTKCINHLSKPGQQIEHEDGSKENQLPIQKLPKYANPADLKDSQPRTSSMLYAVEEPHEMLENITISNITPATQDLKIILTVFQKHFIMSEMPIAQRIEVANRMRKAHAKTDQILFKQGDTASAYFIIDQGAVEISIGGKVRKRAVKGESFGDQALLYGVKRTASVRAITDCTFWVIDRQTFKSLTEQFNDKKEEINRKLIEQVKIFEYLTTKKLILMLNGLRECTFYRESIIVDINDPADNFYVIKKGSVRRIEDGTGGAKSTTILTEGNYFGQKVFMRPKEGEEFSKHGITVIAEVDCELILIPRQVVDEVLAEKIELVTNHGLVRSALEKIQGSKNNTYKFSKKSEFSYEIIFETCEVKEVKKGNIIMPKGSKVDRIMVSISQMTVSFGSSYNIEPGKIILLDEIFNKRGSMQELEEEDEQEQSNIINRTLAHSIVAEGDGKFAVFLFKTVVTRANKKRRTRVSEDEDPVIGSRRKIGALSTVRDLDRYERSNSRGRLKTIQQNALNTALLSIESLMVVNKIGFSQFGETYICEYPVTKTLLSVKVVEKEMIEKKRVWRHIRNEIEVLERIKSPWVLTYYKTLKDSYNYYFVSQLIRGKQLSEVAKEIGIHEQPMAAIFTAQIMLAVEYLHGRHIVHRDIKLENMMLCNDGYIKLVEMGTAKVLKKSDHFKTKTVLGTPNYMAPEVLLGKGYTFYADLWSVGICLYELVCGNLPFKEETDDPFEIYEAILRRKPSFPVHLRNSLHLQNLILRLLSVEPAARFGGNFDSLKTHSFFRDLDWAKLEQRNISQESLYLPRVAKRKASQMGTKSAEEQLSIQEYFENRYMQIKKKSAAKSVLKHPKSYQWENQIPL